MGKVVLLLVAIAQQSKVLLGTGEVIVGGPADPIVIWMRGDAVAHDPGNYF